MSNSTDVQALKRLERMVGYAKALGNFCEEYYDSTDPYTPHGECPFWTGSECVLQSTHPSNWDDFVIAAANKVEEETS